jgi:hypothetical protein
MSATLYSGPAKVYRGADSTVVGNTAGVALARAFQAEGENGPVVLTLSEDTAEYASAMFGRIGEQLRDQILECTFRPFDSWSSLDQLYPIWIGVGTRGNAGNLQVGGRPFGLAAGGYTATEIWTPDARLYTLVRSAVTGHPSLHLGVGKALFGDAKITGLWAETVAMGTDVQTNFLTVAESAAADPGGAMILTDFVRGKWTGAWGTVAGFGGDGGTAMEAEEEWTIDFTAKYSPLKVQGHTLNMKLDSVNAMARFMPYGPTHTQILSNVGAHTQGQRLGAHDLTLTGPSSKTITLKNAEVKGAGFKFGGTTLGTGEVGFVIEQVFTAGVPQPILIFSA